MLVWINNNNSLIVATVWIGMTVMLIPLCLVCFDIVKNHFIDIVIESITFSCYLIFISTLLCADVGNNNLAKALRGEYGQRLVETQHFYANKNAEELQKLSKNDGNKVTVWHNKKKYDDVEVESKEGKEEKIVFAYPKATVKGIKTLKKEPYIYVYYKEPKYRFD